MTSVLKLIIISYLGYPLILGIHGNMSSHDVPVCIWILSRTYSEHLWSGVSNIKTWREMLRILLYYFHDLLECNSWVHRGRWCRTRRFHTVASDRDQSLQLEQEYLSSSDLKMMLLQFWYQISTELSRSKSNNEICDEDDLVFLGKCVE